MSTKKAKSSRATGFGAIGSGAAADGGASPAPNPEVRVPVASGVRDVGSAGGYTVLARRYRSQEFDELVGQEAVVRTLRNAIAQNRVAHAYLFTGTRGVGKTSAARLLAKELCRHPRLDAAGLVVAEVPSEIESIGAAILRGGDLDVIEIDAASNTGVDNVRDLIAGAGLAPARCPYKVYIIDEVHMLSRSAFNALLKIMEEPPPHVKFILCTTEPQKVPATIQSRCQRFDFRGIPAHRIAAHLRSVLEQEGFEYEEEAVLHLARLAAGSMRDALTLLDRLLAAADARLDAQLVETMLGLPDASVVRSLVEAIAAGDAAAALAQGDELIQRGNTVDRAIDALVEHFRNLMLISVCGATTDLFEGGADSRAACAAQAALFEPVGLVHRIAQCEAAGRAARGAIAPRAIFDALLVRLALAEHLVSVAEALRPGTGPGTGRGPTAVSADQPEKKKPDSVSGSTSGTAPGASSTTAGRSPAVSRPVPRPTSEPVEAAPAPQAARTDRPAGPLSEAAPMAASAGPARVAPVDPVDPAAIATSSIEALWNAVQGAAAKGIDAALVSALRPVAFDGRTLRLAHADAAHPMAASIAQQGERLHELVRRAAGRRIAVVVEAAATPVAAGGGSAQGELDAARQHPLVRDAMHLFDAVVVGTERPAPRAPATEGQPSDPDQ